MCVRARSNYKKVEKKYSIIVVVLPLPHLAVIDFFIDFAVLLEYRTHNGDEGNHN